MLLVAIYKNGEVFRTFKNFHAPGGNVPLHALRAAVKNNKELKVPLLQQELCALNQGHTRGDTYSVVWGPATTIRTPKGGKYVGWAGGTWRQKV